MFLWTDTATLKTSRVRLAEDRGDGRKESGKKICVNLFPDYMYATLSTGIQNYRMHKIDLTGKYVFLIQRSMRFATKTLAYTIYDYLLLKEQGEAKVKDMNASSNPFL